MKRNRVDAAAAVFFSAMFVAACGVALWFLIDTAVGAVD